MNCLSGFDSRVENFIPRQSRRPIRRRRCGVKVKMVCITCRVSPCLHALSTTQAAKLKMKLSINNGRYDQYPTKQLHTINYRSTHTNRLVAGTKNRTDFLSMATKKPLEKKTNNIRASIHSLPNGR